MVSMIPFAIVSIILLHSNLITCQNQFIQNQFKQEPAVTTTATTESWQLTNEKLSKIKITTNKEELFIDFVEPSLLVAVNSNSASLREHVLNMSLLIFNICSRLCLFDMVNKIFLDFKKYCSNSVDFIKLTLVLHIYIYIFIYLIFININVSREII